MIDDLLDAFREELAALRTEVEHRRAMSRTDPVADGVAWAADRLEAKIGSVDVGTHYLSVREYARLHDCSEPAVRLWIAKGELHATMGAQGWRIRRTAVRQRKPRVHKPTLGRVA
jgi:excisionase family DNA binding protein